jgi:hypothetical protein
MDFTSQFDENPVRVNALPLSLTHSNHRSADPILLCRSGLSISDRNILCELDLEMFPPPSTTAPDPDSSIRQTDNDAALARLSAVRLQYLADPFISLLIPRAHLQPARAPLINIGTHARAWAMDTLVEQWLSEAPKAQILSMGAGSDTRFWRISVCL